MGARTWMLAYVDGRAPEVLKSNPRLDRGATAAIAVKLFPGEKLEPLGDGNLSSPCRPNNEVHIGCFPGLTIIAAKEFGIDYPSRLPSNFLEAAAGNTVYLHAMHSVVDWFAYAIWVDGTLERSLSLSPESGILEDIGPRRAFEEPYWAGQHPVPTDPGQDEANYPLPFHPLELGRSRVAGAVRVPARRIHRSRSGSARAHSAGSLQETRVVVVEILVLVTDRHSPRQGVRAGTRASATFRAARRLLARVVAGRRGAMLHASRERASRRGETRPHARAVRRASGVGERASA